MKNFIFTEKDREDLVNFIKKLPFESAAPLINYLQNLKEVDEPKEEPKKK